MRILQQKRFSLFAFLFILAFACVFLPFRALACSCAPQTPKMYEMGADIIFRGEVKTITRKWDKREYEFKILEVIKGLKPNAKMVRVQASENGAECGVVFEKGTMYKIYAILNEDKKYETNLCMGNRDFDAEEGFF